MPTPSNAQKPTFAKDFSLGLLTPQKGIMKDPEENDFRRPDLAWVRGDKSEIENVNFGNYASFLSMGPIEQVREAMQVIAQGYADAAQAIDASNADAGVDAAVLYWENPKLGLAMGCEIQFSDGLVEARNNATYFPEGGPDVACGYVSGDVSWGELLDEVAGRLEEGRYGLAEAKLAVEFVRSVMSTACRDELEDALEEHFEDTGLLEEINADTPSSADPAVEARLRTPRA